jgi:hypothetical protein
MQKNLFSVISALLFIFTSAHAQQLQWGPTPKVDKGQYKYLIDRKDGVTYMLMSNYDLESDVYEGSYGNKNAIMSSRLSLSLVKFNKDLEAEDPVDIKYRTKVDNLSSCFIQNNKIELVYLSGMSKNKKLQVDEFDLDGKYLESKTLEEQGNKPAKTYMLWTYVSPNHDYLMVQLKDKLTLLDRNFNKVWEVKGETKDLSQVYVLDDGTVVSYWTKGEERATIKRFDPDGNSEDMSIINDDLGEMKVDTASGKVYLVSLGGETDDLSKHTHFFSSSQSGKIFYATSYRVTSYDLAEMKKIKTYAGEFNLGMLEQEQENEKKKKKDKVPEGIPSLNVLDVHTTENGDPIVTFYQLSIIQEIHSSQNGSSTTYIYGFGDIINVELKGTSSRDPQTLITRSFTRQSQLEMLGEVASFYRDNKLYIVFNSKTDIETYTYSSSLKQLDHVAENTNKDHAVYLDIKHPFPDGNKVLFLGKSGKKVVTATLTL